MKKLILSVLAAGSLFATAASAQSIYYGSPYYGTSYGSAYGGYYGTNYRAPAQYINIGNLDAQPNYGGSYYNRGIVAAGYRTTPYTYPTYNYTTPTYSYATTPAYTYPSYSTGTYSYPSYSYSYPSYNYGTVGSTYIRPASARVISTTPYYGSYGYGYPTTYSGGYSYGW